MVGLQLTGSNLKQQLMNSRSKELLVFCRQVRNFGSGCEDITRCLQSSVEEDTMRECWRL